MKSTLAGVLSVMFMQPASLRTWRANTRRIAHVIRAAIVGLTTAGVIVLLTLLPVAMVIARRDTPVLPLLFLPLVAAYQSIRHSHARELQALHDELTGLPNRRSFQERAQSTIRHAEKTAGRMAVMLLDLDRFKEINDTLGHHSGDRVLREIGRRLEALAPDSGCIARFGGDEFALLAPVSSTAAPPAALAAALCGTLEQPFVLDGFKLHVGCSIGIALYPDHGADIDTLLQRADIAMYTAKDRRTSYEMYSTERDRNSRRRLAIQGELHDAMTNGQLTLAYQPKIDVRTGELMGLEALARWDHPVHGVLPPSEFVPLAEHSGLIQPLTKYLVSEALTQLQRWRDAGLDVHVAVNLSAQSLQDVDLPVEIADLLWTTGVPASALTLELTESSIMADPPRALRVLNALHAMGIRLAIDDFGTGYSSLSYLRQLPVNELKIDQSFVKGALSNQNDAIIIRSTVDLGRNLGLVIVAEGVEEQEHLELLKKLGCDGAQGFLVAKPLRADAVLPWYRHRFEPRDDDRDHHHGHDDHDRNDGGGVAFRPGRDERDEPRTIVLDAEPAAPRDLVG